MICTLHGSCCLEQSILLPELPGKLYDETKNLEEHPFATHWSLVLPLHPEGSGNPYMGVNLECCDSTCQPVTVNHIELTNVAPVLCLSTAHGPRPTPGI